MTNRKTHLERNQKYFSEKLTENWIQRKALEEEIKDWFIAHPECIPQQKEEI